MSLSPTVRHRLRNGAFILLSIIALLFLSYRIWIVPAGSAWLLWDLRHHPDVRIVPTPIQAPTDPIMYGQTFSFHNVSFTVPWTQGAPRVSTTTMLAIKFPDHKAFFITKFDNGYSTFASNPALGSDTDSSRAFYNAIVNVTPSDLHLFAPLQEQIKIDSLLIVKAVIFGASGHPVYTYDTSNGEHVYVFTRNATSTLVSFFTPSNDQYDLSILGADQTEINSIVESIRTK
jgi:hypothetical protein